MNVLANHLKRINKGYAYMAVAKERLYTMVQLRIQRLYILGEKYSFKK